MINPYADRPVYLQLADILRAQIMSGDLAEGAYLPAETRLASEHAIGRDSVRSAVAVLRSEGLVETTRPRGTRVRARDRTEILLELGSMILYRVATDDERRRFRLPVGGHVAEVIFENGADPVQYAPDRHIFRPI